MAEMLVRTVDKKNTDDIYKDVGLLKRGDVVVICEDGHKWSTEERTAPYWQIVKVPGAKVKDLIIYTIREPGDPRVQKTLQRRAYEFDLLAHDGSDLDTASALALKVEKPPIEDPNVIG